MLKILCIHMSTNCGRQASCTRLKTMLKANEIVQPFKYRQFTQKSAQRLNQTNNSTLPRKMKIVRNDLLYRKHSESNYLDSGLVYKETLKRIPKKKLVTTMPLESNYLHSVLKGKPCYHKYLAYNPVSDTMSVQEIHMMLVSSNLDLPHLLRQIGSLPVKEREIFFHDEKLSYLLEDFVYKTLPNLCNSDFIDGLKALGTLSLRCMVEAYHRRYHDVIFDITEFIGKECEKREDSLDFISLMVAADFFFTLHFLYLRYLPFYEVFWTRMENETVDVESVVPLLFNASVVRTLSYTMRNNLLRPFLRGAHQLSLDECAVICSGFHKTDHPVRSLKFNEDVICKMINEIDTAEEISVCAIFKALSRTYDRGIKDKKHSYFFNTLKLLSSVIGSKFDDYSLQGVIRIISFYNKSLLMNENMQKALIMKVKQTDLKALRIKEISKISFLLGMNRLSFDGIEDVVNAMAIKVSTDKKGRTPDEEDLLHNVVRSIIGMFMLDHYPEKLINICATLPLLKHPDRLRKDTRRMLFQVDQSIQIERPDYKCGFLSHLVSETISEKIVSLQPKLNVMAGKAATGRERLVLDVMENLQQILGGPEYFDVGFIFDHFDLPDIEMYFDGKEVVKVEQKGTDLTRVVLCVHADNAFSRLIREDGTETFSLGGLSHMRQRQFQKIGCVVIPVIGYEYHKAEDKERFIRELLSKNVDFNFR